VQDTDVTEELRPILNSLDKFYAENDGRCTVEDVGNILFSGQIKDKDLPVLKDAVVQLHRVNGSETVQNLLETIKTKRICQDISGAAFDAWRGYKSVSDVLSLAEQLRNPQIKATEFVTDDIHEILNDTVRKPGLRWRLGVLNRSLGSLRKGDFGFVFARPETGKTTFLASEVSFMASQVSSNSGPILWFNNEEQGKKVKLRCYQAALGATLQQIMRDPDKAKKIYTEKTHGKIKIFDSSSTARREVEAICAAESPSLIIFDQIDKVKGFSEDRGDLVMGAIYQWARELAKTYAPVIGVCQADGSAEGEQWLHMGHVSNAKTAKQAEADFILGIGKQNQAGFDFVRYINISKNKLTGDEDSDANARHARWEVLIKPETARYEDMS
jgi:replicative DNA helicase